MTSITNTNNNMVATQQLNAASAPQNTKPQTDGWNDSTKVALAVGALALTAAGAYALRQYTESMGKPLLLDYRSAYHDPVSCYDYTQSNPFADFCKTTVTNLKDIVPSVVATTTYEQPDPVIVIPLPEQLLFTATKVANASDLSNQLVAIINKSNMKPSWDLTTEITNIVFTVTGLGVALSQIIVELFMIANTMRQPMDGRMIGY